MQAVFLDSFKKKKNHQDVPNFTLLKHTHKKKAGWEGVNTKQHFSLYHSAEPACNFPRER